MEASERSILNISLNIQEQTTKNTKLKRSVERVTTAAQKSNLLLSPISECNVELKEIEDRFTNLTIYNSNKENYIPEEESQRVNSLKTLSVHPNKEYDDLVYCSLGIFMITL